jgi:hypothetical protein
LDKAKFEALLPIIVASLMQKISERKNISHNEIFLQLYNSQLYSMLENEKTKVWHYSTEKLFLLFDEESVSGKLVLPEI